MLDEQRDTTDRLRRAVEGVIGVPTTEGNGIDVLRNGDEIFPAMLDAIDGARHTIDFLTFVYWKGSIGAEFAEHLAARAGQGIRVRVLLDSYGAQSMDPSSVEVLERSGAQVQWFRPLGRLRLGSVNHRTHRKVMIVDEAIAFTGGVGIADEWRGNATSPEEWRDTHFRIRGPAVDGLRAAFLDNWSECDLDLFDEGIDRFPSQPKAGDAITQCVRGAAETGWSDIATLFRTLLQLARERVRITTAYFIPDADLTERMCAAAARGVRVELLLPGPNIDKRFVQLASEATFDRLLAGGVHIWSFQPAMLHAKVMTVDGLLANVGSANLNTRSTQLDEEVNLVVLDPELVATLDGHFDDDLRRSVQLDRSEWRDRSIMQRAFEFLATPARRWF
jgi:cardiolipin synthase